MFLNGYGQRSLPGNWNYKEAKMAEYEIKPNTFVLFRNKTKPKETSPDFSGTYYDDNCVPHFLDAWSKEKKSDKEKFLGGKRGNPKTKVGGVSTTPRPATKDMNDEVPF
jgi:hypothetical protein